MQVELQSQQSNYFSLSVSSPKGTKTIELERSSSVSALFEPSDRGAFALGLSARKILERVNEQLGVKELKPEQAPPRERPSAEQTSDNIMKGIAALYDAYMRQDDDRSESERIDAFMSAVRKGVEQGFGEAFEFLEQSGAFEEEGLRDEVLDTKKLLDEKLDRFESLKKDPDAAVGEAARVQTLNAFV